MDLIDTFSGKWWHPCVGYGVVVSSLRCLHTIEGRLVLRNGGASMGILDIGPSVMVFHCERCDSVSSYEGPLYERWNIGMKMARGADRHDDLLILINGSH